MNWEYCECGCHGHEASAGVLHFWLFNDLKGNFYLHRGHGWLSPRIGRFKTWEEAEAKAVEVVNSEIIKLQSALKK
jgi:hypothetical protein